MAQNKVTFTDETSGLKLTYYNIRRMKFYPKGIEITDKTGCSTFREYKNFDQMTVEVYEEENK